MTIKFLENVGIQLGFRGALLAGLCACFKETPPKELLAFQAVDGILFAGIREISIRKLSIDENDTNFRKFGKIAMMAALFFAGIGIKCLIFSKNSNWFEIVLFSGANLLPWIGVRGINKAMELWKNREVDQGEKVVKPAPQQIKKVHTNPTRLQTRML